VIADWDINFNSLAPVAVKNKEIVQAPVEIKKEMVIIPS
tara:strand:- start:190 stop:306 length:117 start_codon:yes stop_codon:yes gene_type:complete